MKIIHHLTAHQEIKNTETGLLIVIVLSNKVNISHLVF